MQYQGGKRAAGIDSATADYNAKVDQSQAQQLELDTAQNLKTERAANAVYLSQQEAAYASAGVLADSGSPLHAMVTNAGRMEQHIQQQYTNSQQKVQQYYSSAKVGRLEGAARAESDRASGTLALVDGGARIAGLGFQGYQSGAFNFGGTKVGTDRVTG
jgi:hypothetical protein